MPPAGPHRREAAEKRPASRDGGEIGGAMAKVNAPRLTTETAMTRPTRSATRLAPAALLAAALPFAAPFAAWAEAHDTVVATVNGNDITGADLRAAAAALPQQYQALPPEQLLQGLVEQLVRQRAVIDAAGEETPEITAQVEALRRNLVAQAAVEAHLADAISDEEVQAAYEAGIAGFEPQPEYRASHILLETEEDAQAVAAELEGGADFAELARERSTGPTGPRGGDLGWFGAGQMVPEFEEAVKALEPGAVSAPVQTQFGWHVIKLDETRESSPPALEEIRPQIEETLRGGAVQSYVDGLLAEADVTRTPPEEIDAAAVLGR